MCTFEFNQTDEECQSKEQVPVSKNTCQEYGDLGAEEAKL